MQQILVNSSSSVSSTMLERVMNYPNPEIVERYKDKLNLTHEAAEQLFHDVKQFLYICMTQPGMWSPTEKIDDGWHEFLLYTRDYREFCKQAFGHFVDHVPRSYLNDDGSLKGLAWTTYLKACDMFGTLSENWEVPNRMRPAIVESKCHCNPHCKPQCDSDCLKNCVTSVSDVTNNERDVPACGGGGCRCNYISPVIKFEENT